MAAQIGSDDALESVLTLAHTPEVRGTAIWPLGAFKHEKALKELRLFLKDENEEIQFRAAQRLSERKDSSALEVLLIFGNDPNSRWRAYAMDALLKYPDDPRVQPAIKSRLDDRDSFVRQSAEFALRKLAKQEKQKP
jgi:HEAT repeat protein